MNIILGKVEFSLAKTICVRADWDVYDEMYTYDANGNMTRDDSREIASITYNPINLPALTRFADIKNSTRKVTETNAIYTDYRADGFKTSRLNRTIYITTATKVNSKGETIVYDKSTGVDNQRYYYGNLMKENGKVKHIYNEAGYVDVHEDDGTYCYNFYVRDYLGSTRAVISQWGDLAQTTDYFKHKIRDKFAIRCCYLAS